MAYYLFILAVGAERLVELAVARRNSMWTRSRGQGVRSRSLPGDSGHACAALGCVHRRTLGPAPALHPQAGLADGGSRAALHRCPLVVFAALGKYWNTRIIVVPGAPLVRRGPYRWMNHPNYAAVTAEVAALPLVHSAWLTAIVFSIANALVLNVRIRDENAALGYA